MLTMTSRRKQIKPIKAQSNQIPLQNTFTVSDIVDIPQCQENQSCVTTILLKQESMEMSALKIETVPEFNSIKKDVEEVKYSEKDHSVHSMDIGSEDVSKKIHKDDAKILPIETSGGMDFFQCPICDESSICGRENLTCHLQEHQNKTKRDDGKHLCCLCSKELSSNSSLERHLLTHSNHRPFSCILCDKKFTTNGNLSRHIKTSHNNNGTIDSSIDEVLKKHQQETAAPTITDSVAAKSKKSHKTHRKEPLNLELLGLNGCTMNFMTSSAAFLDQQKSDCNIYQQIIQSRGSNINVLSPFYSFNVNDLGFIQAKLTTSCNNLNQNSSSIVETAANESQVEDCSRNIGRKLKRNHFNSLLPNRMLATLKYRQKIDLHIHNLSHVKRNYSSTNSIDCAKCHRRILLSSNLMSHIRLCYRSHNKKDLFCPFKLCSKKSTTLKRFLRHIRYIHLDSLYQSIEPVSPPMEPLNLSIKDFQTNYPMPIAHQIQVPSKVYPPAAQSCESVLDLSGSASEATMSNISDISPTCPVLSAINQFISTPTIVSLSPFQFSTPLTFSSASLLGKPSTVPVIINNSPLPSNLPSVWNGKLCPFTALNNYSKVANNNDGETSSSNSLSSKYMPGVKKKNSYKDAPKLITCPMDGCVQKFPWNSSLMRHILTHTAHKPFKCTRCVKSFSTKSNRERHMTRVHRVRINRLKFKSLQASRSASEDLSRSVDDGADSETGADAVESTQDTDARIMELSEEEWIIMDDNDRRAEDISSNLLKLAGQPIVEPNPVRLHNVDRKADVIKCESSLKKLSSLPSEQYLFLDNNCT